MILIVAAILMFSNKKEDDVKEDDHKNTEISSTTTSQITTVVDKEVEEEKEEEEENEEEKVYVYIPEKKEPVWFFSMDRDFSEWNEPMPFVNPMGDESIYSDIYIEEKSYYTYYYIDDQNVLRSREVYGDTWVLKIPFDESKTDEENFQFIDDIEKYLEIKNGIIIGNYDKSIVFVLSDDSDTRWWAEAIIVFDEIWLNIVKEDEIKINETIVINTDEYENNTVHFSSYNPGDEYQSIYLEYDGGDVYIDINTETVYGEYKRQYRVYESVYDLLGTRFYFDSIMYDEGYSNWEVSWNDPDKTTEIRITLEKTGILPKIKYGEPLGAIKVSSEHVSNIEAFPVGNSGTSIDHPEFSYDDHYLDQAPDGDFIMFVPAGRWNVKIYPVGGSLVSNYETLLVPVNSGEMTIIDIPYSISNALRSGKDDYNERGIRIGTVKEDIEKNVVSFYFTLLDESTKDILPNKLNTQVFEGGVLTELINVERVKSPPNIVLLLDSSGSMKGQMQETLDAAKVFIQGLPDNAVIQIVDFDDKPKELEGTNKEQAVNNLTKISVGGDTALYDAVGMGIDMLAETDRPTIVVFTDGENDVKYSGGSTIEETLDLVYNAGIPLFTIGFGEGHDSNTLEDLAEVSAGQYFSADDNEALNMVFAAINEKLGSTFEATYERPLEASIGDMPVVSFVIDTSGSMMTEDETYGSRIYNVKKLLHEFIIELPDEVQMQLTEFDDDVKIVQTLTTNKMQILRGVGRLEAAGGTDIIGSVEASYKTLKQIPSTKKVLIYITDAALRTSDNDNEYFQKLLSDMKKDEINVLWVGLGIEEEIEDFKLASELTGGEYIVTEDIDLLNESFNNVLREVEERPKTGLSNLSVRIEKLTETGARESYATSSLVELSPIKKSNEVIMTETIKYTTGKLVRQYDRYTADYISGEGIPAKDTTISKRMEVGKDASNGAAKIHADEILFMKRLDGVDAPANYRFMAITMDMENILKSQEVIVYPDGSAHPSSWLDGGSKGETTQMKIPYMIPDFLVHFSLSYNNEGAYPASLATWLTEKALAVPGNYSITIIPDSSVTGTLVFLVPDTPMEQSSLHFYDVNYGHIDLPLVGEMMKREQSVSSLPTKSPTKLSDTFSLEITGYEEIDKVPGTGNPLLSDQNARGVIPGYGSTFRVVEGKFTSLMQALINIDPMERFSLRINTQSGDFYIPVNPVTNLLPAGFMNPRMMSPGSFNKVKWLFEIPEGLENSSSQIFVDLQKEDKVVDISEGRLLASKMTNEFDSEFIDLTINDLVEIDDGFNEYLGRYIIADITVHDKKDGYSSYGIGDLFSVVTDEYFLQIDDEAEQTEVKEKVGLNDFTQGNGNSANILLPSDYNEELILGYSETSIVYDGTSRRGIILFEVPYEEERELYLYSEVFEGLKLEVNTGTYDMTLLGEKIYFETDYTFTEDLNDAVSKAVEKYQINHPEETEQLLNGNIQLDGSGPDKQEIQVPMISLYGAQLIEEIDTVDEMIDVLKHLQYIPSKNGNSPFSNNISKEALMTQGFGTEQDIANMAVEVLARLGYHPKIRIVELTDRGRTELSKMSGVDDILIEELPAVSYIDDDGGYHVIVIPFIEDLDILDRLVYLKHQYSIDKVSETMTLNVKAWGYQTVGGSNEQIGDIADALGGDDEGEDDLLYEVMFDELLDLDTLSLDSIDLGIAKEGDIAKVFLITADGEHLGNYTIDLKKFDVKKIELVFDLPHKMGLGHIIDIEEGMEIDDIFFTISINSPELSKEASEKLQETSDLVYEQAEDPSELSALRWYGRSLISKFISSQTIYEKELAQQMDLLTGRTEKPRVIVVTQKAGEKLQTSISLIEVHNMIHDGPEEAVKSFNIMSGLYASSLESFVLSDDASGLEKIWSAAPSGTELVLLDSYISEDVRKDLENAGISQDIIKHFESLSDFILITDKPSVIDGKKRWAWYEIDPETYEMKSVLDTLEKGAFVESTIINSIKGAAQYVVGAFKGVETSVWSVAAFSLEKDDYNEILKSAKALALGIADRFGFKMGPIEGGVGGKISISQTVGPVKFSFDGSASASQNVLGFTDGYKAGVEYYFQNAN